MEQRIVIAGFGGQGVLSAGRLLAYAGMIEGRQVCWLPSYGPEMRGGTANSNIILSDQAIGSPIVTKSTCLIAMNTPSLDKFKDHVVSNGMIIEDASLVKNNGVREDICVYRIPATKMALELNHTAFALIFLIGKMVAVTRVLKPSSIEKALFHTLKEKYRHLIPQEMNVLKRGMEYA